MVRLDLQSKNSRKDKHKSVSDSDRARQHDQEVAFTRKVFRLVHEQNKEEDGEGSSLSLEEDDNELNFQEGSDMSEMSDIDNEPTGENLADIVMAKIEEHTKNLTRQGQQPDLLDVNPHVIEVYTKVGVFLSRYKSGPIPKAFKILPTLQSWRKLLDVTSPETWTPHATLAATKIFISNLDPRASQRFLQDIFLPKIRGEIAEHHKLSSHSYQALKHTVYKPSAFFKGLLLPLCNSPSCTLREAMVVGSVVSKVSIPAIHSGAAILKLCEMDYSGPQSIFLRVLLDKKYALPYQVVDGLVLHFMHSAKTKASLPVLWHQSFLVFVQRYKQDLTTEQRDRLLEVLKQQNHSAISQEIRREFMESESSRQATEM